MIQLKASLAETRRSAAGRGRAEPAPTNKEKRATVDRRLPGIDAQRLNDLGLTRREVAVLELVAEGRTNERIAEALRLSPLTVKKHLERMSVKLGARNRASLVAVAWQRSVGGGAAKRRPEARQARS